jgi:hypothetical protein
MIPKLARRSSRTVSKLARSVGEGARTADHIWRDVRTAAGEHRLGTVRLLGEVVMLRAVYSLGILDYFRYGLFDPSLTRDQKLEYLSNARLRSGLSALLSPGRYRALYDNKLIFNRYFGDSIGLSVAEIYGVYDPAVGRTRDGRSLRTAAELDQWLRGFQGDGFAFKPAEGGRGRQIRIFDRPDGEGSGTWLTLAGERFDADALTGFAGQTGALEARDLKAHPHAYLLQERLRPHPALAALVGGPTLCTARVVTIVALDGTPRIIAAMFKIQPGTTGVDNLDRGAVGCWVDPDSGTLSEGRTRSADGEVTRVPGTERTFVGFRLPHWTEVKQVALKAAAAFPWARAIGWDIAITEGGPVLIEGNERWGTTGVQMLAPHGLLTGEFKALCEALADKGPAGRQAGAQPARTGPRLLKRFVEKRLGLAVKAWRVARDVSNERGGSTLGILREEVALHRRAGVGPQAYYYYRLFDPALGFGDKSQYLPDDRPEGGRATRLHRQLTPDRYRALYDNKLIFNRYFGAAGLPVAEIYAVYDPSVGHTLDGRSLRTAGEMRQWLESFPGEGFVFKPAEGGLGHQILVFEARVAGERGRFSTLAGEQYDAERLVRFAQQTAALQARDPDADPHAYLLQKRLRPHHALEAFVGPTLCCVRALTYIALDGTPRLHAATFKLQPGKVGVDHLIHGAVSCWVDTATGVLGRGRTRDLLTDITLIPGSDRSFVGFQLPHWAELKRVALAAAAAFPWARAIGWDIAITEDGPVLIEGNARWFPSLVQLPAPGGLMTGDFKQLCEALAAGRSG